MKPFEIQSPSLSINGVLIDTSVQGKLVIPGVTRASTSVAIEVDDTEDQTQSWGSIPTVIDGYHYAVLNGEILGGGQQGWSPATYEVEELDDDGYIDDINVVDGGAGYTGEAVTYSRVMFGTNTSDPINNFDPQNWVEIPFRVRCGAGEIESEFSGGGGASALEQLEDVDLSDPQDGQSLVWDSNDEVWKNQTISGGGSSSVTTSDSAPENPSEGDLWFDTESGQLYVYFGDAWVDSSPATGGGADTGNVTFDDVAVQGTGTLKLSPSSSDTGTGKFLQVRAGENDSHIHFDSGDNSTYDLILGDDAKYVQVDHTGNILLQTNDNNGMIASWAFDYAGAITLPDGGKIEPVGMGWTGITNGTTNNPVSIINKKADDGTALSSIQLNSNNISGSININVKDTVDSAPTEQNWYFWADGTLQLPPGGDIVDSDYNSVLGGSGGTSLPSDAAGYLRNDGSGTLSWNTNTVSAGMPSYSNVWVFSNITDDFWSTYTLSGNVGVLMSGGMSTGNITMSATSTYGKTLTAGDKIFSINDTSVHGQYDYIVFELPSSPNVGDVVMAPAFSLSSTLSSGTDVTIGVTYTISTPGNTNWLAVGAQYGSTGETFIATSTFAQAGQSRGTGTATYLNGVANIIWKPATGHRYFTSAQMNGGGMTGAGQGFDYIAGYIVGAWSQQPISFMYAGLVDNIPTWYQGWF